jgi:hypothetical protein
MLERGKRAGRQAARKAIRQFRQLGTRHLCLNMLLSANGKSLFMKTYIYDEYSKALIFWKIDSCHASEQIIFLIHKLQCHI